VWICSQPQEPWKHPCQLKALDINSELSHACLLAAQAYEILENYEEAFKACEETAWLADEQCEAQLVATAKIRMAYLMQMVIDSNE